MEGNRNTTDELLKLLKKKESFKEYLEEEPEFIEMDLSEYLECLMEEKQVKKAEVIRKSLLDRTYAYQIFSGTRRPNQDKVLALAFGIGLSVEETQKLLRIAKCPVLYVKNKRDSMILFGLDKHVSLGEMNELLYEMHENIIE